MRPVKIKGQELNFQNVLDAMANTVEKQASLDPSEFSMDDAYKLRYIAEVIERSLSGAYRSPAYPSRIAKT